MNSETQPLASATLEPSKEAISAMSFGGAIHRAIDDLFTCLTIAAQVQAIPPSDALETLIETWKQGLDDRLEIEAQAMVDNVASILELLRSGEPFSARELAEWSQTEHWYATFPVATICREDLRDTLS